MRDEAPYTRLVFMAMLILSDKTGLVEGTPSFIASYSNISLADVNEALSRLMSPDANSTTPDMDGVRVVKEGNNRWRIVNFTKYYAMDRHKERTEYMRDLMREKRSGSKDESDDEDVSHLLAGVSNVLADVSTVSPKKKRKERKGKEFSELFSEEDCIDYATHLGLPATEGSKFWNYHESTGWTVGKSGKPIVNRMRAMVTWKTNYLERGGKLAEKTCTLEEAIAAVNG